MCTLCRTLFCGNHRCEEVCHSWVCHPCPLLPENVRVCPCGKVPMSKLLPPGEERTSCLDPVPTCDNTCGRLLPCSTQGTRLVYMVHACMECREVQKSLIAYGRYPSQIISMFVRSFVTMVIVPNAPKTAQSNAVVGSPAR